MRNLIALLMILTPLAALAEEWKATNKFKPDPRNGAQQAYEGPHVPEMLTEEDWQAFLGE